MSPDRDGTPPNRLPQPGARFATCDAPPSSVLLPFPASSPRARSTLAPHCRLPPPIAGWAGIGEMASAACHQGARHEAQWRVSVSRKPGKPTLSERLFRKTRAAPRQRKARAGFTKSCLSGLAAPGGGFTKTGPPADTCRHWQEGGLDGRLAAYGCPAGRMTSRGILWYGRVHVTLVM